MVLESSAAHRQWEWGPIRGEKVVAPVVLGVWAHAGPRASQAGLLEAVDKGKMSQRPAVMSVQRSCSRGKES